MRLISELLSGIRTADEATRARTADEVTDVHKSLSDDDVRALVVALVSARLSETDPGCQEAQLNALSELVAWHAVDASLLGPLRVLRDGRPLGAQEEFLGDLLDE